jgi:hypothetical protein
VSKVATFAVCGMFEFSSAAYGELGVPQDFSLQIDLGESIWHLEQKNPIHMNAAFSGQLLTYWLLEL